MKKAILPTIAFLIVAFSSFHTSFAQNSQGYWQLLKSDPFPDTVTQVVAGPGDLVYMATSDKGVFKSTDEGENWVQINTGLNGELDITMLALGPHGDLLAREGTYGNIFYSKDGSTWTSDAVPWYWTYPGALATAFTFDSSGVPYVGTLGAGIYSRNEAGKWQQLVTPEIIPGAQAMLFDHENRLVVHYDKLYRLPSNFMGIDSSWPVNDIRNRPVQLLRSTWGSILVVSDTLYELTQGLQKIKAFGDMSIVADSSGMLYSFMDELYESSDRGQTWSIHPYPIYGGPSNNQSVAATSYGFISSSEEGGPYVSVSLGSPFVFRGIYELDENLHVSIQVDRTGTLQAFEIGGDFQQPTGGIWSSSDQGKTWRRRETKQAILSSYYPPFTLQEDGNYYAYLADSSLAVSQDGVNFRPVTLPPGTYGRVYASANGTLWLYYGSAHFLRSFDGGVSWKEFAHLTDVPPPYFQSDSAYALGIVERAPYIWLATNDYIHVTSDDGQTWSVDTAHYFFESEITGGRGYSIITHTSNQGIHWLSPGENPDSSWLFVNGTYAEDPNGTMLQFAFTQSAPENSSSNPESLIRESKDGEVLETMSMIPDSLTFPWDNGNLYAPSMAIDSEGNIYACSYQYQNSPYGGLYKFILYNASVHSRSVQSEPGTVSINNNMLSIAFDSNIENAELYDVTGRAVLKLSGTHSTELEASIGSIPNGIYLVKTQTEAGQYIQKIAIIR